LPRRHSFDVAVEVMEDLEAVSLFVSVEDRDVDQGSLGYVNHRPGILRNAVVGAVVEPCYACDNKDVLDVGASGLALSDSVEIDNCPEREGNYKHEDNRENEPATGRQGFCLVYE